MPDLSALPPRFQQQAEPEIRISEVHEQESKEMKTIRMLMQQNNAMRALINANLRLNKDFKLTSNEQASSPEE